MTSRRLLLFALLPIAVYPNASHAGAWDSGSFGNDAALDWILEFAKNPSAAFVRRTLDKAKQGTYIESMDGQAAIAAAEVVACALGRTGRDFPNEIREATKLIQTDLTPLASLALNAVEQVAGSSSELRDLWAKRPDSLMRWNSSVQDLLTRLKENAA